MPNGLDGRLGSGRARRQAGRVSRRVLLALLALVVVAAGVAVVVMSRGSLGTPVVKVNIVTWPGYGPIYAAQAKGFFKDEGVDVDCQIQEDTSARHAALVAGQIDLIGITLESVILANAQGIPMQVIGITDISDGADGILARKEIKSIKDLVGKRVAFPEGQPSHLFLLYHLDKAGLSATDVKPVLTDDAGKAGELFSAGQVDAAVTWEPWLSKASQSGLGHVLVNSKGVDDILIGIFAANRTRVPDTTDKLQRFLRGWYRGLAYVQANRREAIPIMAKGFKLPEQEFGDMLGGLRFIGLDDARRLLGDSGNPGRFAKIAEYEETLWRKAGVIKKPVDLSAVYTSKILAGVK
jgi:NitT/TauT family transport system substrate-binding protein